MDNNDEDDKPLSLKLAVALSLLSFATEIRKIRKLHPHLSIDEVLDGLEQGAEKLIEQDEAETAEATATEVEN